MNKVIEKLKNNFATFSFMSIGEQEILKKAGKDNCLVLHDGGHWMTPLNDDNWNGRYRLKPDYQPEQEVVECKVIEDCNFGYPRLVFAENDKSVSLEHALCFPNFIGYKYEDGSFSVSPRKPTTTPDKSNSRPAEIPVSVLFAKGE